LRPTAEWIREMTVPIDDFCADGFLVVRGAVAPDVVRMCIGVIERELRARAIDPYDPVTSIEPVLRVPCPERPAFAAASASSALPTHQEALQEPSGLWLPMRPNQTATNGAPTRLRTCRSIGPA